ncbi:hypothetical protein CEXT_24031 [Caerostris extrusa]|uniref:Uncharacterized protein n=1 Tax=Caerostris extrusa TaxID=172846 RepID=A0AAV4SH16_CAEEX|nr:hypothetical protein CEXT_24031 [Caerostris extrusa]
MQSTFRQLMIHPTSLRNCKSGRLLVFCLQRECGPIDGKEPGFSFDSLHPRPNERWIPMCSTFPCASPKKTASPPPNQFRRRKKKKCPHPKRHSLFLSIPFIVFKSLPSIGSNCGKRFGFQMRISF